MVMFNMTGDDTFIINTKPIHPEFSDGDTVTIDFPNELCTLTTGKDSNTIYALNEQGSNFDVTFSVMRGGAVDKYLNGLLANQKKDFVAFPLMTGAFTKRLGDGFGKVSYDTYVLRGMAFTQNVNVKGNVTGDGEQGKAEYRLKGALAVRGIV